MTKKDREKIKRSRMMKYFIDAANKIINTQGIDAVNIRDTADLAGYSSATLYNYFDNLTHLVFLATFDQLEDYNQALAKSASECENSLEVYMKVCKCFCDYAYNEAEIYEILFFSHDEDKFSKYSEQYYELFPEKDYANLPSFLGKMLKTSNIHARSLFMLEECVNDGFLKDVDINDFNSICLSFNKAIIQDVKAKYLKKEEATKLTLRYYYFMFRCCIKDEFKDMLDNYYDKIVKTI